LNVIFIQYLIIYLGDSAAADRAFATRFFLSYLVFVFQFKHKTKRRQRSNPEKIGPQSLANPHNTINYILLPTVFHLEPLLFWGSGSCFLFCFIEVIKTENLPNKTNTCTTHRK